MRWARSRSAKEKLEKDTRKGASYPTKQVALLGERRDVEGGGGMVRGGKAARGKGLHSIVGVTRGQGGGNAVKENRLGKRKKKDDLRKRRKKSTSEG